MCLTGVALGLALDNGQVVSQEHRRPLDDGADKLGGRQLLRYFPAYGWFVGRVVGSRSHAIASRLFDVCYTNGDKEELTWNQLCPKLLPVAPLPEKAEARGCAQLVTVDAQILLSSNLRELVEGGTVCFEPGGSATDAVLRPPSGAAEDAAAMRGPEMRSATFAGNPVGLKDEAGDEQPQDAAALSSDAATCSRPSIFTHTEATTTHAAPVATAGVSVTHTLPQDTSAFTASDTPEAATASLATCPNSLSTVYVAWSPATARISVGDVHDPHLVKHKAMPHFAWHTGGTGVRPTAAAMQRKAALKVEVHTGYADAARPMAVPNNLKAAPHSARHMGEASTVSPEAAPN
eukprot:gene14206-biopygen14646